eukprot:Hpha_TRINITY_DN15487_c4_g1::TRINITY_DN15487_c4_g1_i2::g.177407::m.177407
MQERTTCLVTGVGEYEEQRADETGRCDPDITTCEIEARSSVNVRYTVAGEATPRSGTAWSSIDGGWESDGSGLARNFLERFGEIGEEYPCWYDPDTPSNVRLWDQRYDYINRPAFWVPFAFFGLCLCMMTCYVTDRYHTTIMGKCGCTRKEEGTLLHDEEEMGAPRAEYVPSASPPPPARRVRGTSMVMPAPPHTRPESRQGKDDSESEDGRFRPQGVSIDKVERRQPSTMSHPRGRTTPQTNAPPRRRQGTQDSLGESLRRQNSLPMGRNPSQQLSPGEADTEEDPKGRPTKARASSVIVGSNSRGAFRSPILGNLDGQL